MIYARYIDEDFYFKPFEVHDKLMQVGSLMNPFYDDILRNATIVEDWERDPVWIWGKFKATPLELGIWTRKTPGHARATMNRLIEANIVVRVSCGSYALPWYKTREMDAELKELTGG